MCSILYALTPENASDYWRSIRIIFGLIPGGDAIIAAKIYDRQTHSPEVNHSGFSSLQECIHREADSINTQVSKGVSSCHQLSNRLLLIKLQSENFKVFISEKYGLESEV